MDGSLDERHCGTYRLYANGNDNNRSEIKLANNGVASFISGYEKTWSRVILRREADIVQGDLGKIANILSRWLKVQVFRWFMHATIVLQRLCFNLTNDWQFSSEVVFFWKLCLFVFLFIFHFDRTVFFWLEISWSQMVLNKILLEHEIVSFTTSKFICLQ